MKCITKEGSVSCAGFPWRGSTPICHRICQSVDYNITHCLHKNTFLAIAVQYVTVQCSAIRQHVYCKSDMRWRLSTRCGQTTIHCIYIKHCIALEPPCRQQCIYVTHTRHCTGTTVQRCIYVAQCKALHWKPLLYFALLCFLVHRIACKSVVHLQCISVV